MGPAPRGSGDGPVPTPPRSWVSKQPCARWSPSDWIGRSQEEPARVCPSLSAPCRVVGGTAPLGSRTGRWPGAVARSGNYISSSGRRRDTGRGESFCDQVRAGEAEGGAAAPRAYSRSPWPRPELPGATDWPECGPRPLGAPTPRPRRAVGGGTEAGPGHWGPALGVLRAPPARPLCK